jgi:hypothetical protein
MEFNPNFTYMLQSSTAEDNVYHKVHGSLIPPGGTCRDCYASPDLDCWWTMYRLQCFRCSRLLANDTSSQ